MFVELMPIIEGRALTITVAKEGTDGKIRVNLIPKAAGDDKKLEEGRLKEEKDSPIKLLTRPLSLVGTPEEIDEQIPVLLRDYADTHKDLITALTEQRDVLAEAAKIAKEATEKAKKAKTVKAEEKKQDDKKAGHKEADKPLHKVVKGEAKAPADFTLWNTASEANAAIEPVDPVVEAEAVDAASVDSTSGEIDESELPVSNEPAEDAGDDLPEFGEEND